MNKLQIACAAVQNWDEIADESHKRMVGGTKVDTNKGDTRKILAEKFNVSSSYIQKARNLMLSDPDIFDKVVKGDIPFPKEADSGIYLIHMEGTDFFKIGVSTCSLSDRISNLQTGNPCKLVLRGWIESDNPRTLESDLHKKFANFSCEGEWFKFSNNEFASTFYDV